MAQVCSPTLARARVSTAARGAAPRPVIARAAQNQPGAIPPSGRQPLEIAAQKSVWSLDTFWPMAPASSMPSGDPQHNLWAKGGVLEKFDDVLSARGLPVGARRHELQPALASVVGRPSGRYVPARRVLERDFEQTSGVSLLGGSELRPNIEHKFLERLAFHGARDGALDTSWWGSCNDVALAGLLFDRPRRPVQVGEVPFTAREVCGLLTLIARSQSGGEEIVGHRYQGRPDTVVLRGLERLSGEISSHSTADLRTGRFARVKGELVHQGADRDVELTIHDGAPLRIPKHEVFALMREDREDPSPAQFFETAKRWLSEGRPFAMDVEPGPPVWNYAFDRLVVEPLAMSPTFDVRALNGHEGPVGSGAVSFHAARLTGDRNLFDCAFWLERAGARVVNSGWLSDGPDFMWRPNNEVPTFTGVNPRNPFVLPAVVKEIYERSI